MYCKIKGCRFPNTHTTRGHQCGKCKELGHGQLECGKLNQIHALFNQYGRDKLPFHMQCNVQTCKGKWTHTTDAHFCEECKIRTSTCEHCILISVNLINKQCPICKQYGNIDLSLELFTGGECVICMEQKKMILFDNCKHANICKECCLQLN